MHEAVDAARTGAFLCTLRKARGMTQEQVAEALCISNKTISKWESGAGLPDITILPDLAEFYGVTADDLLAGQRLQSAERTAGTRQKHRARLYRRAEFRLTVLGLCMAVLPLCALLLGSLFSGLYDSTVLGLRGVALLTALFSLLAVLGLNYGGLQLREGLADLEDPDGGLLSRLELRQKRFLALTLAAVCGCCWQLLGSHPQYFLAVTGLSGADGRLRASLLDGARCGSLLLALLAVFLVLGRRQPDLLGQGGKRLFAVEYGLCWLAVLVPVALAVRAAFFVRRLQALTDAAWMLVYYASRAFLPLLLVLLASFTAYILLKKEEI